jgi:hypothetical protein
MLPAQGAALTVLCQALAVYVGYGRAAGACSWVWFLNAEQHSNLSSDGCIYSVTFLSPTA